MRLKAPSILAMVAGVLAFVWYTVEPWAVTFLDDGPYYSSGFSGPITELPVQSKVELRRIGQLIYTLESRFLSADDGSVLVLRDAAGSVRWTRVPMKPDGKLGPLQVRQATVTWYGGWRIAIQPAFQEGGYLYLGVFGGFRFFNHSW